MFKVKKFRSGYEFLPQKWDSPRVIDLFTQLFLKFYNACPFYNSNISNSAANSSKRDTPVNGKWLPWQTTLIKI